MIAATTAVGLVLTQVHAESPASAAPSPGSVTAPAGTPVAQSVDKINYRVETQKDRVLVSVDAGSLRVADSQLQLVEPKGKVVAAFPLDYRVGQALYHLGTEVDGRKATLVAAPASLPAAGRVDAANTTVTVTSTSTSSTPATNEADAQADRVDKAFTRMGTELSLTMAIGTSLGTIIGGAMGCLIGLPAGGIGCIPGLLAGATAGAVVGSVVIGGIGALVAMGIFVYTMAQPMTKPKPTSGRPTTQVNTVTPTVQAAH